MKKENEKRKHREEGGRERKENYEGKGRKKLARETRACITDIERGKVVFFSLMLAHSCSAAVRYSCSRTTREKTLYYTRRKLYQLGDETLTTAMLSITLENLFLACKIQLKFVIILFVIFCFLKKVIIQIC